MRVGIEDFQEFTPAFDAHFPGPIYRTIKVVYDHKKDYDNKRDPSNYEAVDQSILNIQCKKRKQPDNRRYNSYDPNSLRDAFFRVLYSITPSVPCIIQVPEQFRCERLYDYFFIR